MATLTKGYNFAANEVVTPIKLNNLVDLATVSGIVNADISSAAAIADSKLATISTTGKVSNSATTATNLNTGNTIVARDLNGNFSAGTITATTVNATTVNANLTGTASAVADKAVTIGKLSLPSGFPIQIVQAVKTDVQTIDTSTNDWVDVTGLSITLTRTFATATGKVRIQALISGSSNNANHGPAYRIVRDTSVIGVGITDGNRIPTSSMGSYDGQYLIAAAAIDFIDAAPGATSTVTYKIQARITSSVLGYINRSNIDTNVTDYVYRAISTMTLTELA